MENKLLLLFLSFVGLQSCQKFNGEKIVLNYRENYIQILSNEYVIDSLTVSNGAKKYYQIGLSDKKLGSNKIYYKRKNNNYKLFIDSLKFNCKQFPEVNVPSLQIVIRKKGYIGKLGDSENDDLEFASYNQIPCNSSLIDTVMTHNPYK